ncbi:hypothetical protein TorRG33x02_084580, partial [Trema orientale]
FGVVHLTLFREIEGGDEGLVQRVYGELKEQSFQNSVAHLLFYPVLNLSSFSFRS